MLLLTLDLNQCQTLVNYGDIWRHCIRNMIHAEFTDLVCKLYLMALLSIFSISDYNLLTSVISYYKTKRNDLIDHFLCQLNFVVKSANIFDNLEVAKSSKCSFFHNKAIFVGWYVGWLIAQKCFWVNFVHWVQVFFKSDDYFWNYQKFWIKWGESKLPLPLPCQRVKV